MSLPIGLYDQLVTEELAARLNTMGAAVQTDELASGEAAGPLLDLLSNTMSRLLESFESDPRDSLLKQLELVNGVLLHLRQQMSGEGRNAITLPQTPARRLRAIRVDGEEARLPETGLAAPWLFTAAKASPSLYHEIQREATDCDQIDILVSFITVSGVRKLMDVLRRATAPDASGVGRTRIRVLTTTYTGATEQVALDMLARLTGCEVKVSLDGRRTRLHAKAWIFHRATGFGSAYIGSANLSGAALLGGLEWTVKLTEHTQRVIFERAKAHFETLWEDNEFSRYDPDDADCHQSLARALSKETGRFDTSTPVLFDITAKQYQTDILEQLQFERAHGRTRNLLVAATGTGKTVMAALDYKEQVRSSGSRPRLLFVSHRGQLLTQALDTYRAVLGDHSFGALLVAGQQPASFDHLFASIQSLTSQRIVERCGAGHWHTVVIDECHRIAAPQFEALARGVEPKLLLGLTATPERTDGEPIATYFDSRPDGSPAAELRLWQALDLQLLAPFEYFGCNDETDFSEVPWNSGGETAALDNLLTGNHARARMVIHEWERLSGNARKTRAIVFCVSVRHAEFMTAQFVKAGLSVVCLTGDSSDVERREAPQRLARGEICAIVTVDLYNEGVDIPSADTLLFLRPTQSALVFQQQLGRGLRLHDGKSSCLVLDFVGRHRSDFRFDKLISSVTGLSRREVLKGLAEGFSTLPSGCHIHLEAQARDRVLANLRSAAQQTWGRLRNELQSYAAMTGRVSVRLADFLHDQDIELSEIYRESTPSGWTSLRRAAGLIPRDEASEPEALTSRSLRHLLHVDDPAQISVIRRVAEAGSSYTPSSTAEGLRAQMLTYQVEHAGNHTFADFTRKLEGETHVRGELSELADILESRSRVAQRAIPGFNDVPLVLHARYERREILTAIGLHTATARPASREGVLRLQERKVEVMFVTLDKSDGFRDQVAYHDYAVSPTRFHWETQNSAGPNTAAGQRYIESATNEWTFQLFVRETPNHAFVACGGVRVAKPTDVSGERPMSIFWTLDVPLPLSVFGAFSVLKQGR
ncbi:MAG: ATP-dependent helicase [Gemmatimonadetes bacterium]|nr:MAG: ATP-dependent helicase [Gemmatimonadota bacterium]